ncbi:Hypothetical predicted protein, partial [Mytilus galloprovincialis]
NQNDLITNKNFEANNKEAVSNTRKQAEVDRYDLEQKNRAEGQLSKNKARHRDKDSFHLTSTSFHGSMNKLS